MKILRPLIPLLLAVCIPPTSIISGEDCLPGNSTNKAIAALVVPHRIDRLLNHRFVWPAVQIALRKVREDKSLLPQVRDIKVLGPIDNDCVTKQGYSLFEVTKLRFTKAKISVVIGPLCDFAVGSIARVVRFLNIAVITPGCFHYLMIQDRQEWYSLVTRLNFHHPYHLNNFLLQLFSHYNWTQAVMLMQEDDSLLGMDVNKAIISGLVRYQTPFAKEYRSRRWPFKMNSYEQFPRNPSDKRVEELLLRIGKRMSSKVVDRL